MIYVALMRSNKISSQSVMPNAISIYLEAYLSLLQGSGF